MLRHKTHNSGHEPKHPWLMPNSCLLCNDVCLMLTLRCFKTYQTFAQWLDAEMSPRLLCFQNTLRSKGLILSVITTSNEALNESSFCNLPEPLGQIGCEPTAIKTLVLSLPTSIKAPRQFCHWDPAGAMVDGGMSWCIFLSLFLSYYLLTTIIHLSIYLSIDRHLQMVN